MRKVRIFCQIVLTHHELLLDIIIQWTNEPLQSFKWRKSFMQITFFSPPDGLWLVLSKDPIFDSTFHSIFRDSIWRLGKCHTSIGLKKQYCYEIKQVLCRYLMHGFCRNVHLYLTINIHFSVSITFLPMDRSTKFATYMMHFYIKLIPHCKCCGR